MTAISAERGGLLTGRRAVVTGGAGGIAGAIATAYAREGAAVLIVDRDQKYTDARAWELSGSSDQHPVLAHCADLTNPIEVEAVMAAAAEVLGGIDILVNGIGWLDEHPLLDMDIDTWDRMMSVDLRSVFLACKYAVPYMVSGGWGRVINIASQLGQKGGIGMTHYCAAKAGVIGMTRALALELVDKGITVNAIAPGPIETSFLRDLSPSWRAAKEKEIPIGRFGTPEEVAPTAVLLASDPGGNLFIGQTIGPNGGDVML